MAPGEQAHEDPLDHLFLSNYDFGDFFLDAAEKGPFLSDEFGELRDFRIHTLIPHEEFKPIRKKNPASGGIKETVRTLAGALLIAVLWYLMGWALSSHALGVVLCCWSLVAGPLLLPPFLWLLFRGRLRRFDLSSDRILANEYFRGILRNPGPAPRIWVKSSSDRFCFWFERGLWFKSTQTLLISSAWLAQNPDERRAEWQSLWDDIAAHSPQGRRLRSLQLSLWFGALSPLEILLFALRFVLETIRLGDLPTPAFLLQSWAWSLKRVWFGTPEGTWILDEHPSRAGAFRAPGPWNSILWGPWVRISCKAIHPLWPLLTHSDALLRS